MSTDLDAYADKALGLVESKLDAIEDRILNEMCANYARDGALDPEDAVQHCLAIAVGRDLKTKLMAAQRAHITAIRKRASIIDETK